VDQPARKPWWLVDRLVGSSSVAGATMVKVNWGFLLLLTCLSEGSSELLGKSTGLELKRPCPGIGDKKQAPTRNAKGHSIPPLMRAAELKEFGEPSQQ
jgi:hypothetical protein